MNTKLQYLQIEPTTRCNYTCGFCAGRHMAQTDIKIDEYIEIINSINDLRHLELQGEGEALLHPHFFEMVDYAKKKFPDLKISLITNGSLFDDKNIEKIILSPINTILVSIESPIDEEFQKIRGGKLSRVKRGIKNLIAHKNNIENPLTIGFAVTVLKETITRISMIAKLYEELAMDGGIVIQPLQGMDCYTKFYDEKTQKNIPQKDDKKILHNIIATDQQLDLLLKKSRSSENFYFSLYSSTKNSKLTCPWLENGLFISANGMATSCCYVKNYNQHSFERFNKNLTAIFQKRSELLKKILAKEIPEQCKSCNIAERIRNQP